MNGDPILSKRVWHGAQTAAQSEINHLVNRSQGLTRTQCALPLRSLCATAGSQRIIRRAERCNPNKEEKKEKMNNRRVRSFYYKLFPIIISF